MDLVYKHIVAIFDGDKENEKNVVSAEFPECKTFLLKEADIRDKEAKDAKAEKTGIADKHGKLKEEYRDYAAQLLKDVNAAFPS